MRRYIVTGAPGAGKTTLLAALRGGGWSVVDEAATDVIARARARGRDPSAPDPHLLDAIARLQRRRERRPAAAPVQLFDRSPVCTLALARYLGLPVPPLVTREVERVVAAGVYEPQVFLVHLLGFVTRTDVRRITLEQSVRFARFHVNAYREHGFELVDVPAGPVARRVSVVEGYLARLGGSARA